MKSVLQTDCPVWRKEKCKLLLFSLFGIVCKKLPHTSCKNIIKNILCSNIDMSSVEYGRIHEKYIVKELEAIENAKIMEYGLFVNQELSFLGSSSDGIAIDSDNFIVEIKCPSSCVNFFPNEAILQRHLNLWKLTKQILL